MRLVDLDKVRELFRVAETCDKCQRSNIDCDSERTYYTARDICGLLDEAEEVDMDVVRCKECKWWHKDDEPDHNGRCECNCNGGWWLPEDYCSSAERRDADES